MRSCDATAAPAATEADAALVKQAVSEFLFDPAFPLPARISLPYTRGQLDALIRHGEGFRVGLHTPGVAPGGRLYEMTFRWVTDDLPRVLA